RLEDLATRGASYHPELDPLGLARAERGADHLPEAGQRLRPLVTADHRADGLAGGAPHGTAAVGHDRDQLRAPEAGFLRGHPDCAETGRRTVYTDHDAHRSR